MTETLANLAQWLLKFIIKRVLMAVWPSNKINFVFLQFRSPPTRSTADSGPALFVGPQSTSESVGCVGHSSKLLPGLSSKPAGNVSEKATAGQKPFRTNSQIQSLTS